MPRRRWPALSRALVVVIGDTNSTLGVTLAAAKLRIPVVHVEAGLRAADRLMAEELNRRAVDAMALLLCTPCASATARMRTEHPDAIVVQSGDVAYDALQAARHRLPAPTAIVPDLEAEYLFATLHRAELTDRPELLREVLLALAALPRPTVLALHPRTHAALAAQGLPTDRMGRLRLLPAVGYLESLALAQGARAVITDSGGLQREAYWLGTPCVTVRDETEWGETLLAGANILVPPARAAALGPAVEAQCARGPDDRRWAATAYGDGRAGEAVTAAVAALLDHPPASRRRDAA